MTVALNKDCGLLLKTLGSYQILTALTKHTRLLPNALGSYKALSALNQILTARTIYSKILPNNLGPYKAFLAFAKYSRLSLNTLGHFQLVTLLYTGVYMYTYRQSYVHRSTVIYVRQ